MTYILLTVIREIPRMLLPVLTAWVVFLSYQTGVRDKFTDWKGTTSFVTDSTHQPGKSAYGV